MSKFPAVLRAYWIGLVALFALAFGMSWFFVHVEHRTGFPYAHVILPPIYNGVDISCFSDRFQHFHQLAFFGDGRQVFNYPAPVAVLIEAFYASSRHPVTLFRQVFGLLYVAAGFAVCFRLRQRSIPLWIGLTFVLTTLTLAYPFLLAFYLDNTELAVWLFVALGLWLYVEDYSWASVACFGVAGSMKYFPLVYLGLALAKRQYRQVVFGVLTCVATTIASLAILGPSTLAAYRGLRSQMPLFTTFYVYKFHTLESGIDHSLFGIVKLALGTFHHLPWLHLGTRIYLAVVAAMGLTIYFLRIKNAPMINQVLMLSIASVLLPPISHDYTLTHLYGPWVLLTFYALRHPADRRLWLVFACFLVLFTPQNYLILTSPRLEDGLRVGGQIKAMALVVLFICGLRYPFSDSLGNTTRVRPNLSESDEVVSA